MIWKYINKNNINNIICTNKNTNEYRVILTPNNKFDKPDHFNNCDTRYISTFIKGEPTVKKLINVLISLQKEYHNSEEIKQFSINDKTYWFNNQDRASLINSFTSKKHKGSITTTLWLGDTVETLDIDEAINIVEQIEDYSTTCYNVTQQHLLNIKSLLTIEECLNYDITANYPDKLNIKL